MTDDGERAYARGWGAPPLWVCSLLGLVLIAAGVFALSDVVFAATISIKLIGLLGLAAGAFEIIHAFWTKGWGGLAWQILLGAIYVALGLVLLLEPASGAIVLTYLLGALLVGSGIVRCVLGVSYWHHYGWMMLLSGTFGLLAGLFILSGASTVSPWLLGLLLGIDLSAHGLAWLLYAFQSVQQPA